MVFSIDGECVMYERKTLLRVRAVVGDFDFVSGPEVTARLNDDFSDATLQYTRRVY
jgi:hypothetical protein